MLDVAKVAHGGYVCELVRELSPPHKDEPELFELLVTMLDLLDGGSVRAENLRVFELRLLDIAGLRPTVDQCAECGQGKLDEPGQVFDRRRGGVICAACHGHGRVLDGDARRALVLAQSLPMERAGELTLLPAINVACRGVLAALLQDHLGKPLKSLEFIAKLNAS